MSESSSIVRITGATPPTEWTQGMVLEQQANLGHLSQGELTSLALQLYEDVRDRMFMIGDAAIVYCSRAPIEQRARAIREFCQESGVDRGFLWGCIRCAVYFPPSLRARYQDKPKTWYNVLADRTHVPGDTPESRMERVHSLAASTADLNTTTTREVVETFCGGYHQAPEPAVPAPASSGWTPPSVSEIFEDVRRSFGSAVDEQLLAAIILRVIKNLSPPDVDAATSPVYTSH